MPFIPKSSSAVIYFIYAFFIEFSSVCLNHFSSFSSVATHWLPKIIREFQKDYPGIDYELLLGDYTEIEEWIAEGRVDCGFLRLPTRAEFDTIELDQDELLVVLPEDHPRAQCDCFPVRELCDEPFMLLEKGARAEISEIFERNHLVPDVHFTTWDDYAVMSMVESGLGISILPSLILQRIPYHIVAKKLDVPAFRTIGLAMRNKRTASLAVRRFLDYLDYRR
ncbi:MAG: LysR family transcriptional regulator substrate-binding protein [Eubacteriaceae bacterium]|jgi:DNA-binding transcriptional LysR family regulator